jgi:hypothetical protein
VLWFDRPWEELSPLERFFSSLVNARVLREREWVWESKFGSCTCPVCRGRGHLYWTNEGNTFRFGCKECDRESVLDALGLDAVDVMDVAPKWLRNRPVR